ncbi:MAG: hypothetical protein QOJ40_2163 [Verrucomicrobiota bacterium]
MATRQTSRMAWAACAALLAVPAILLTGCLTTEPPSSANTTSHIEKTFSPQPVPPNKPIQLTLGPTTKDRAEVVPPVVKQPQKAVEAPKPKVEPVAKLIITSPKNTSMEAAKKAPTPVAPVSVRASETPARPAVVSTVSAPQGIETPGALIFKGDKSASKEYSGGNARGVFGKNAMKWVGGGILLAVLLYACCPPLRARVQTIKDNLARRADVSRRFSGRHASKWSSSGSSGSSKGKFKVKGAATLAPATPFGDDTRRDQK